jgi:tRNA (guanine37-N1)-methyltransferase
MNREKSIYLKIEKVYADTFLKLVQKKFGRNLVLDNKKLILHDKNYVEFPINTSRVKKQQIKKMINNKFEFEFVKRKTVLNPKYKYKNLKEALIEEIPRKLLKLIPNSYDVIGNIAILEFNKFKENHIKIKTQIAKSLVKINNSITTVYEKKSIIKGIYRLREFKLLFGEDISETVHKENGCQFRLDIKKAYFSPRLVYERKRISTEPFRENEIIIDMFAGVGTFSIQIAKQNNVEINGIDINPEACDFFRKNIELNKIKGNIIVHNLDVRALLNPENLIGIKLKGRVDRIIMNLPEKSLDFIDILSFLIKNTGAILHFYQFSEKPHPIKNCIKNLKQELNKNNLEIEKIFNAKIVKPFSPKSDLVVIDLKISLSSINQFS